MPEFSKFTITVPGPENKVKDIISHIYGVKYLETGTRIKDDEYSYIVEADKDVDVRKPLFNQLAQQNYPILELKSLNLSLEDIFLQLTTNEEKEVK